MLKRHLPVFFLLVMAAQTCAAAAGELAPQTSDARAIKVTVTPRPTPKAWEFDVTLETHTRNVDDDLAKAAQVMADGKRYAPLGWEGAPPGGHHRKGVLLFPPFPPPRSLQLQIRLANDPEPRTFKWLMR